MNLRKITVFIISTIVGFFIGKWVSLFISWLAPRYFNIDPGFLTNWFSKKPTLSNTMMGYIIYSCTALAMFMISNILSEIFKSKSE